MNYIYYHHDIFESPAHGTASVLPSPLDAAAPARAAIIADRLRTSTCDILDLR